MLEGFDDEVVDEVVDEFFVQFHGGARGWVRGGGYSIGWADKIA
jgi:hypothetical protein